MSRDPCVLRTVRQSSGTRECSPGGRGASGFVGTRSQV